MKNYLKVGAFMFLLFYWNVSFIGAKEHNKRIMKKIIKLAQKSQAMDTAIIKRMRFDLLEEQIILDGSTEKCLLKDNSNIGVWLFKSYTNPKKVIISRSVYLLAKLMGISTPLIYEITLPVNGKMVYGSIQEFILGAKKVKEMKLSEFSDKQIAEIKRCQIFSWLIFNKDSGQKHLIVHPETKEIFTIDNDNSLVFRRRWSIEKHLFGKFDKVWNADTGNRRVFELKEILSFIDYLQSIDNKELKKILLLVINKPEQMNEFFLRKENLKSDFIRFYCKLKKSPKRLSDEASKGNGEEYARLILKELKASILKKKQLLKNLKSKPLTKQKDIKVISSKEAWIKARKLSYSSNKEFLNYLKKATETLKYLENSNLNIYERLAVNLYTEEIARESMEGKIDRFINRKGIKRISIHPVQMTAKKILNIEYNLRAICGKKRKSFSEYKKELANDKENILLHLNYIKYPPQTTQAINEVLEEYQQKIKKEGNIKVNDFICKITQRDEKYLNNVDDSFTWKYLGLALVNAYRKRKNKAIGCCNKSVALTKDNFVVYWSYLLLGLLYEYNDSWERFGEGFKREKSVKAYKKAVMINPESVEAHLNLGIIYLINKEPDKVLEEFKQVDRLDVKYGKKHFHFSKIKEKYEYKSKEKYLEAIKMNTLSGRHHYVVGLAYMVNNDVKRAKQHFNKAKEFGYKVNVRVE